MTPVIILSDGYLANSYENIIGGNVSCEEVNVSCEEVNNEFMVKNRQNKSRYNLWLYNRSSKETD